MIWVVDKQIVRHLIERDGRMAEVPVRVSFEYAVDAGTLVDDSLTMKTLYNRPAVCKCFPGIEDDGLDDDVQQTVDQAIREHLAFELRAAPASL